MTPQLNQAAAALSRKMSYEEFLEWEGENQHVEWVNGKVIEMAPVGYPQQDLKGFLLSVLRIFVERFDLGKICDDPFQMKMGPEFPGRAPDILFVAKRNLVRLHTNHLEGPADLVIEISGPGSRRIDGVDKFREYQKGGVPEYWLLDPERKEAKFYRLDSDGNYQLVALAADGIHRSEAIKGLWIRVDWLWQTPLPSVLSVLQEWGLVK